MFKPATTFVLIPILTLATSLGWSQQAATPTDAGVSANELARIQAYLDARYTATDILHSFETKAGQTVDCIDFFVQPSVKALAARGTPVTKIPTPPPLPKGVPSPGPIPDFAFNGKPDQYGRARTCKDSVPFVRITAAEIVASGGLDAFLASRSIKHFVPGIAESDGYAHIQENFNAAGPTPQILYGVSTLSVNLPFISPDALFGGNPASHSLSQLWLWNGGSTYYTGNPGDPCSDPVQPSCAQTVEAGWIYDYNMQGVSLPGHAAPQFFVLSTNNGYGSAEANPICPSVGCPVFTPYLNAPLAEWTSLTDYNVPGFPWRYTDLSDLQIAVESDGGYNWWVYAAGGYIGSYSNVYTGDFQQYASTFMTGAEVQDTAGPTTGQWLVPMGTGVSALAGLGQAAYQHDFWGCNADWSCSSSFSLRILSPASNGWERGWYDYSEIAPGPSGANWVNHIFFGNAQPAGSYGNSCNQCTWSGSAMPYGDVRTESKLECECLGANGREDSTISLPCTNYNEIDNINGQLTCGAPAPQPVGSYTNYGNCNSCSWSSKYLKCYCRNNNRTYQWSTLGLPCNSPYDIADMNGTLTCNNAGAQPNPNGSYNASCRYCSWWNYYESLQCECSNINGNWITSSIGLPCTTGDLANTNGQLTCAGNPAQPPGSYTGSCRNCTWSSSPLQCQCQTGTGSWVFARVQTPCPSTISNVNGLLQCD